MENGKKSSEAAEHPTDGVFSLEERRPGPTWRAWAVSIIMAIALSVSATLLLGGTSSFRQESVAPASAGGCGGGCCGEQGK